MPVGRATPTPSARQAVVSSSQLSPWPTAAGPSRDAAIARLRAAVAGRASESNEAAAALGEAASARVELEAASAPQSVKDESVIRYAGYWAQSDYGTVRKEDQWDRGASNTS